jgi:predicted RNase H-like HicB family nuclease
MTTLKAIIESLENNYSAYIEKLDGVVATGSTIAEIKANLLDAVDDYIETCKENGINIPEELQGEYNIEFSMDVKSLLNLYDKIFSKSGLERLSGINQKQLWHYANGKSVPRRAQALKLENALHRLGTELMSITL